jgi:hypothetical protein
MSSGGAGPGRLPAAATDEFRTEKKKKVNERVTTEGLLCEGKESGKRVGEETIRV